MNDAVSDALPADPRVLMQSIIGRIATGPDLSKDISRAEARAGMAAILAKQVDPVQAAIFLIALRMKRETDDENLGALDAILAASTRVTAAVDDVVDIADPYDGYTRGLPASPFLPAVLAACGVPAVSHGLEAVGPKYGVTHRQVLRAAGAPVDATVEQAAARLANPKQGWAYVDQAAFCPALHALVELRTLIVKRPVITTVETLVGPVRGRRQTHLVTGYVHKPYPRIYALLARAAGFDSALIVRGVEGGVIPSLKQAGKFFFYRARGEEQAQEFSPLDIDVNHDTRAVPLPPQLTPTDDAPPQAFDRAGAAQATAKLGLAALSGESGPMRDSLVYSAASCLWQLQRFEDMRAAAAFVRQRLDDGSALARFKA